MGLSLEWNVTASTHKQKLSYDQLVDQTGYDADQIYSELPSLIREYDVDLADVNEALTDIEREKIYLGEVVFDDGEVCIDHTGTIDFDADSCEYTGNEPLIRDAIDNVMSKWEAKQPIYDRHPLTAYDRKRYTAILNKRRRELFSNWRVNFGIAFKNREEDGDPFERLAQSMDRKLSGSSRSGVYLSAYIRGHGGITQISEDALAEGVEKYQFHDPSEVLNGVERRDGDSLRFTIRRRYTDYPLHPNKTPYVLQFRELEDDINLPQPALAIYEKRGVYSNDPPSKNIELQTVYTAEGFVPPIDLRVADEYRRSVGQGVDPQTNINQLFRGSPTNPLDRPSQLASQLSEDEVTSQWTVQDRPEDYMVRCDHNDPVDYPDVEVPVYIPDAEPEVLAKYLKPVTIDSYIHASTDHSGDELVKVTVDEIVRLYDIDQSLAEFCVNQFHESDQDGFYFTER